MPSLSLNHQPLSDAEKSEGGVGGGGVSPCEGESKWKNSQLIHSRRLACVIERDTPGGEENFRRGVFEEHLWLHQTVLPSYF